MKADFGDCTINRRDFIRDLGRYVAAVPTASLAMERGKAADRRPNVLLIMTDDQGYGDLSHHGNKVLQTPNTDALARESVELTRFYCSPVCSPTRASLMTGRYHYRTGVIHTSRGGAKMHNDELVVAELFRESGYSTGIFGKWHLGDNYPMRPQDQGFDECLVHTAGAINRTPDIPNSYFDPYLWHNGEKKQLRGYCTDIFTDAAIELIETSRNNNKPFFVYLPTNVPHVPLEVAEKYVEPYLEQGLDEETAKVYGMISNLDENIGRLLAGLDKLGLRDDTLVIFLTDNGPQFPRFNSELRGKKADIYEGGIRVPCFFRWPGNILPASKLDSIAAHIDIFPTLVEACRLRVPQGHTIDGRSLLPLLRGHEPQDWRERRLFIQCHRGLQPKRYQNAAVVGQRYKLVGFPGTFNDENLETESDPVLELYDLLEDPGETNNIAGQKQAIVEKMKNEYNTWFDDMRSSRQFIPGVIHLGSPKENPARLCRYQDATYKDGKPAGWSVMIERTGSYELTINRGKALGKGTMFVQVNGKKFSRQLKQGESTASFDLPAGKAVLDIWAQEEGRPRTMLVKNHTLGDVDVRFLY